MKKAIVLCLLLLITFSSRAQEQDTSRKKKMEFQVGLNATGFIKAFLSFNTANPAPSRYQVNAKALYNLGSQKFFFDALGARIGFGRVASSSKTEETGQDVFFNQELKETDFRVGAEFQKKVGKRWVIYLGIDYVESKSDRLFETVFDPAWSDPVTTTTTDAMYSSGFGPALGFQFNINKHLCLGTELTYYKMRGTLVTETKSSDPWGVNQYEKETITSGNIVLPAFINFNIRF